MAASAMDWVEVQKDVEEKLRQKPADDVKKKIVIPNPVPVGNHLAHFIRSIHWNSKGMLPSTAGSKRSYDKYKTVTGLSFQGPDGFDIRPGEASGGFNRPKECIEDIMLSPRKNQMFNRWKVPDRLVDTAPSPMKPPTPSEGSVATPRPAQTPMPVQLATPPASRMSREMSLPNIKLGAASPRIESRNGLQQSQSHTPRPGMVTPRPRPMAPQRANTMFVDSRRKNVQVDENGVPLCMALKPEAVPQAEEWMKHADKADKKVIERILKMASKKNELDNSLKKTLLPNAKDTVDKWMKDANEGERQVALQFFNSLAGSQLMGMTVESQRKRLKDVIGTLEDAKPGGVPKYYQRSRRRKDTISDGNLKYIRLLTPNTRENRWMNTTWHHLPEYKDDDAVNNWSSHYIRPHAGVPRHFVIHPDWG